MLKVLDINGSALVAHRERMNAIAGNIANAHSTTDADGNVKPVERRRVDFFPVTRNGQSTGEVGFRVEVDQVEPNLVYEPGHPRANEQGYVAYPGVDVLNEFANAIESSRAYEANLTSIQIARQMAEQTLRLLQ